MNETIITSALRAIEKIDDKELMVTLANAPWGDKFLTAFAQNIVHECLIECDQEYDAALAAAHIRTKFGLK